MTSQDTPPETSRELLATFTITATVKPGDDKFVMVSVESHGDYSIQAAGQRFYAIGPIPPEDIDPLEFWGQILGRIGYFLLSD